MTGVDFVVLADSEASTRSRSVEAGDRLRSLRVLLVGPLPPPAGGMAGQTVQLAALLKSEGCSVQICQVNMPYSPLWIRRFKGARAACRLVQYVVRLAVAVRHADLVHVMANSGLAWHLFAAPAIWVAAIYRIPVVVNYRGGQAEPFLRRAAPLVKCSLRRASDLVVPSGFLKDVFAKFGIASSVVPNIIDLSRFQPKARGAHRDVHLIVTRNLEAIYDVATAIHAFEYVCRHVPGARLSIAGDGPERKALEQLVQELGLVSQVRFTGTLDRSQMTALYADADLMLNPSTVDNMPNSVLESLASCVPVVTTNVGGIPYLVTHNKTALLVPPRDPGAMAGEVIRLLDNPKLAESLAIAGLEEVQRYEWHRVRIQWEKVYLDAIEGISCRPVSLKDSK